MARTKVARTRLLEDVYERHKAKADKAGLSPGEYLRYLIESDLEEENRIAVLERRVTHLEEQFAQVWLKEGPRHDQQVP